MVYDWKRNMPVKAQAAGEYLEQLEKKHGEITPKIVLDASRSEDALLHPCFEWNDGVAAEKYREVQARFLIRNLVVSVERDDSPPQVVRAYVNVSSEIDAGSYIAVKTAMQNDDMKNQVLKNALNELKAFQKKYANLQELSEVFSAIDALKMVVEMVPEVPGQQIMDGGEQEPAAVLRLVNQEESHYVESCN